MAQDTRTFTLEELAGYDGRDGRPAYLAYGGVIRDVTGSKIWKGGRHMNLHDAGHDLTMDLAQAPHGADRLDRYPVVGVLAQAARAAAPGPAADSAAGPGTVAGTATVASGTTGTGSGAGSSASSGAGTGGPVPRSELPWLLRASPFLRRHPHPMTVHFPIAFAVGASLFVLLALVFRNPFFATAVHAMNMAGVLFTPLAILTGLMTWKYNYGKAPLTSLKVKLVLSPVLMAQFLICTAWWLFDRDVLIRPGTEGDVFGVMVLSMLPLVGLIGWLGATLTFPLDE